MKVTKVSWQNTVDFTQPCRMPIQTWSPMGYENESRQSDWYITERTGPSSVSDEHISPQLHQWQNTIVQSEAFDLLSRMDKLIRKQMDIK